MSVPQRIEYAVSHCRRRIAGAARVGDGAVVAVGQPVIAVAVAGAPSLLLGYKWFKFEHSLTD